MKKRMLHGIGIAILTVTGTMAQNKTITGKVTLFSEIPVEKAEISIAKTETRIYTDSLGFFTITYGPKDRLMVNASGFKAKLIKAKDLKDSLQVDLVLVDDEKGMQQAFTSAHISGHGIALAKEFANAQKEYAFGFNNMTELIKAKFPQLTISGSEIIFRGIKSSGLSNGALLIMNGSTYDWNSVKDWNVRDVKNIKILSATEAIRYGSGSGNGVILIELYGG